MISTRCLSLFAIAMVQLTATFHLFHIRRKKHFKSATTGVATKNMRNELNRLVNTVTDTSTKKVCTHL